MHFLSLVSRFSVSHLLSFHFIFHFQTHCFARHFFTAKVFILSEDIRCPLFCRLPAGWHLYNYLYVVFSFGSIKTSEAYP